MTAAADAKVAADELSVLIPREREVLVLLSKGLTIGEAARVLGLSRNTVNDHATKMRHRLGMTTIEVAVLAAKAGWV